MTGSARRFRQLMVAKMTAIVPRQLKVVALAAFLCCCGLGGVEQCRAQSAVFPAPQPGTGQSTESAAEQRRLAAYLAGRRANSIGDLGVLIAGACDLQPWQFSLRDTNDGGVYVSRSATLPRGKASCIFAVIGNSKFWVANRPNDR